MYDYIDQIQLCPCQQLSFGFINNNYVESNGGMSRTKDNFVGSPNLGKGKNNGNFAEPDYKSQTSASCVKVEEGKGKIQVNCVEEYIGRAKTNEVGMGKTKFTSGVEEDNGNARSNVNCVRMEGEMGKSKVNSKDDVNYDKPKEGGMAKTKINGDEENIGKVKPDVNCVKPEGGMDKTKVNDDDENIGKAKPDVNCVKPEGGMGKTKVNNDEENIGKVNLDANCIKWEGEIFKTKLNGDEEKIGEAKPDVKYVKPEGGMGKTKVYGVEVNNGKTKAHVNHVKLEGGLGKTNVDCFLEKKDETFFKPVVEADVSMAKDVKGHTKVKCLTSMGKSTNSFHC